MRPVALVVTLAALVACAMPHHSPRIESASRAWHSPCVQASREAHNGGSSCRTS